MNRTLCQNLPIQEVRIPTRFGPVSLAWVDSENGPEVEWIALPGTTRDGAIPGSRPGNRQIAALARDIRRALSGKAVEFCTSLLGLKQCPPFQQRVLLAEHAIPRG